MAKLDPLVYDFDSKALDVFTDSVENFLNAYERGLIPVEDFAGGVRDLIEISRKIPRSVTINLEVEK